jgi:Leucine-rich repeat (LRR) protein
MKTIDLSGQNIHFIPPEVWNTTDCNCLYLTDNYITSLPPQIGLLQNLEELDLSNNFTLDTLPEELQILMNLTYLNLGQTGFKTFPEVVFKISNLKTLTFLGNTLPTLPDGVEQARNLEKLYLTDIQLESISPEIAKLQNLQVLDMSYNPALMDNLDWVEPILQLKKLQTLYLLTIKLPNKVYNMLKKELPHTQIWGSYYNYFNS